MLDRQSDRRTKAVHGFLVSAPSHPKSAIGVASSWYQLTLKLGGGYSCVSSRHLIRWCNVFLYISSCWIPFALSSCGGSIIVKGASTGTLEASPKTVTFGSVQIGQAANTTVSILNKGSAPVQIAQLNLSGKPFSLVGSSHLPVTIAAGATHLLNIQFSPAAAGTATGQLTIAGNFSTAALPVINLSGTGTTGTGSAALSALYCSSSIILGMGTDACTLTLTTAAPSGGISVNLSSSGSAVAVPSTAKVPENATSAEFTATVSSVATGQAVTVTANAGGVMKKFTLQLNAAILALSINATNLAFGDVAVNTLATQPVTVTSTGTVPVTIYGAALTGTGFRMLGSAFPITLSPGQQETLNIEFAPTFAGAAIGQLTVRSDSSTNGTAVVGLSGTGTTLSLVAVAVSPATATITSGFAQQFTVSVTGTPNTSVTWIASGTGCSGTSCGEISSTGLYTAPAAVPSTATVTISATSISDATKSASAVVTIVPRAGATYYLAPAGAGGNDANSGLSKNTPWLSPNHSVNCGDVITAAPSTAYSSTNFNTGSWGTVTCPAGNNVAWLKCAAFDACKIKANDGQPGFFVDESFWGVQGWEVSASNSSSNWCFGAAPNYAHPKEIHHIIFANNVANGCQQGGLVSFNQTKTASVDYLEIIGNIVYNAAQGSRSCYSGISIYQPIQSDILPGTHIYVGGNFSWGNVAPSICGGGPATDGNGIIFDTFDGDQAPLPDTYSQQAVIDNNISLSNGGQGVLVEYNDAGASSLHSHVYVRHNTAWNNDIGSYSYGSTLCGEFLFYKTVTTEVLFNLGSPNDLGCGGDPANPVFAYDVNTLDATSKMFQNFAQSSGAHYSTVVNSPSFSLDPSNVGATNISFANPTTPGPPNCSGFRSVPDCMASVIANFTPTSTAAAAYGYQVPVAAQIVDPLFPRWLCNVNLPQGLATLGCLNSQQ